MNRCKDCRFWGESWENDRPRRGCNAIGYMNLKEDLSIKAEMTDYGKVRTTENFGCVLWEKKE